MNVSEHWRPLPRSEVVKAVERKRPARIPLIFARWWGEGLVELYGKRLQALERYPEDAVVALIEPLDFSRMGLSWNLPSGGAHDSSCVLDDWAKLDEFIAKMPDPEQDPQFEDARRLAEQARAEDRYFLFGWWRLFFERPWGIRGMENLLTDYYLYPQQVHRLHAALCDLYLKYLKRAARELKPDGFWTSDDLGHQTQPFMRLAMFQDLIKPYYVRLGNYLRQHKIHWWLHSCGNNTALLDDLIEAGVQVFHPVQKGTMDELAVAQKYGDRLAFLAGIDVQHILQEKPADEVRQEVRFLIDTFDRAEGGMCIAAGNGIVAGTPYACIDAFLDEALMYGLAHREKFQGITE
jgi:uroporphyrinogen decarboxylase